MSINPDDPIQPMEASTSDSREPEVTNRRRRLVRLALSGAPLMLSLPTAVSAATVSSAYRAAQNDNSATPVKELPANDGWLRIPAGKYIPKSNGNGNGNPAIYKIGNRYYRVSDGAEVLSPNLNAYEQPTSVYLLVLFLSDYASQVPTVSEGVPFPIRGTGQGLHRSAWVSVNPTGTQAYDGVAWVS